MRQEDQADVGALSGTERRVRSGVHAEGAQQRDAGDHPPRAELIRRTHARLARQRRDCGGANGCRGRERIAESMQRGTPEVTMLDAVRAAEAEMRRAARNREAAMATGPVAEPPGSGVGSECRAFSGSSQSRV
jgi:hypothetical protein